MKTYSFFAECDHDTKDLAEIFKRHGIHGTITQWPSILDTTPPRIVPGWHVELKTEAAIDAVTEALDEVPDGHVMVRTLKDGPMFKNTVSEKKYSELAVQLTQKK